MVTVTSCNDSSTWGPCSMPDLKGSPTARLIARALAFSTNSSYTRSCTNVREPAQQHCPCELAKRVYQEGIDSKKKKTSTDVFLREVAWLKNKAK